MKGYTMKILAIILSLFFLTNSAFAGSCPMMSKNIDSKIEEAQKLRDAGVKELIRTVRSAGYSLN